MNYYDTLFQLIKIGKPNLKESSIKIYVSNMRKLSQFIGNDKFVNVDFLRDKDTVMESISNKSDNTIKTYLASIVVVLSVLNKYPNVLKEYRQDMEDIQVEYNKLLENQQKTPSQEDNWLNYNELILTMLNLKKQVRKDKLFTKEDLTVDEFNTLQQYVVACLYLIEPEENPPVRLDYTPMMVISEKEYNIIEQKEHNYLVINNTKKKYFVFHDYKTAGTYGDKQIPVGKTLNAVLNKWLKVNTTGYLLINNKNEAMSKNSLTKFIQSIFASTGKLVSVSLIRHSYLSDRYAADSADKKMIADHMLHSVTMQTDYIKK